jgi:hypothetical protein
MQVSDAPGARRVSTGSKDELRSVGDEAKDRSRSGRDFRGALDRKRGDPAGVPSDVASAAAMAGWFRPEARSGPTPTAAPSRAAGVAGVAVDRILIGSGPDGSEARIRIGAGALAGTEIQLCSVAAGRTVEAQLLTHAASSRQTLSVVLDEIRSRLRDRGIVLSAKTLATRSAARTPDPQGVDDGVERSPAAETSGAPR